MKVAPLLIEIFIQELPFSAIHREIDNVLEKFNSLLESFHLKANNEFFYTPNRLIIYSNNFPLKQDDRKEEFFGPPLSIAYNEENELTPPSLSFINKLNITKEDLETKLKNGKACISYTKKIQGSLSENILEDIVLKWLSLLDFGRSMRWGNGESIFIRPIINITILLGSKRINIPKLAEIYQISKSNKIYPHRASEGKVITNANDYFPFLNANFVIYDKELRSQKIIKEIKEIEEKYEIKVELDSNLLFEVVSITEYPTAIYGEFDEKFLSLPSEVIITSMKINQKYFCVHKNGKLHNGFVFICNATNNSFFPEILKGNMKVLKARLEDALFFYESDIKNFYQNGIDLNLKNIEFIQGFGNLFDKVHREIQIARILLENYNHLSDDILHAIELSKNDLLSSMVNEFGELQGIMGSYYAMKNPSIKLILKEQYLPENDILPSSLSSSIGAIVNKLDSIFVLFSLNKIPSGSKDPFGIRRAANGIIKIIYIFKIQLNLDEIISKMDYKNLDRDLVFDFFIERLEGALGVNQSLIKAAIKSNERDITQICMQIHALNKILQNENAITFKTLFKRVANILKDFKTQIPVNENLLFESSEINLFNKLRDFQELNINDPFLRIEKLLDFKNVLVDFFENVLINSPDSNIRENRKSLVKNIYDEFLKVGDIKEISY